MDPWITLRDEYYILQEELQQSDSPITRRNFVRSVCANVEGTLNYLMGQLAENAAVLSIAEKLAFEEKQVTVKDNGEITTTTLFIRTKTKIKMVFKVLTRYPGGNVIDLGDSNFEKLIRSFKVRDRIMHPRSEIDLNITENEVQDMIDGYKWYISGYQDVLKSITKQLCNK